MAEIKLYRKEEGILRYLNKYRSLQKNENIIKVLYPCDPFNENTIYKLNSFLNTLINKVANTRVLIDSRQWHEIKLEFIPEDFIPSPISDEQLKILNDEEKYSFDVLENNLEKEIPYQKLSKYRKKFVYIRGIIARMRNKLEMDKKKVNRNVVKTKQWHCKMINQDFSDAIPEDCFGYEENDEMEMIRNYLSSKQFAFFKYLFNKDSVSRYELELHIFGKKKLHKNIDIMKHNLIFKLSYEKFIEVMGMEYRIVKITNGYKIKKIIQDNNDRD